MAKTIIALLICMIWSLATSAKEQKLIIIGGGHVGLIKATQAYIKAKRTGDDLKITVFEKND